MRRRENRGKIKELRGRTVRSDVSGGMPVLVTCSRNPLSVAPTASRLTLVEYRGACTHPYGRVSRIAPPVSGVRAGLGRRGPNRQVGCGPAP